MYNYGTSLPLQWKRSWSEDTVGDNWEDTSFITRPSGRRPNRKVDPIRGPRDAYLRPMIDVTGIRQRLAFKPQASMCTQYRSSNLPALNRQTADLGTLLTQMGEEELADEFEVNMMESRQAVNFAGELHACWFSRSSAHITLTVKGAGQLTLIRRSPQHSCSLCRW